MERFINKDYRTEENPQIIEVVMREYGDHCDNLHDWTGELLCVDLPYNYDVDAYEVDDIKYIKWFCEDWENYKTDADIEFLQNGGEFNSDYRMVFIDYVPAEEES